NLKVYNPAHNLAANGDQAVLYYVVSTASGSPVPDGTPVHFSTDLGSVSPATGFTKGGDVTVTFTSGATLGTATISATTNNGKSVLTQIEVIDALPNHITLQVSESSLPTDGVSTASLTVTALDRNGNPVAGQTVRIGLEGDGKYGTIDSSEVVTGTTNASGEFTATFVAGIQIGDAPIRAELISGGVAVHKARQVIIIVGNKLFLPVIVR
ncbi:MAG: hypothetical protein EHM41_17590, partial [Chloroflexi bacterium]